MFLLVIKKTSSF